MSGWRSRRVPQIGRPRRPKGRTKLAWLDWESIWISENAFRLVGLNHLDDLENLSNDFLIRGVTLPLSLQYHLCGGCSSSCGVQCKSRPSVLGLSFPQPPRLLPAGGSLLNPPRICPQVKGSASSYLYPSPGRPISSEWSVPRYKARAPCLNLGHLWRDPSFRDITASQFNISVCPVLLPSYP